SSSTIPAGRSTFPVLRGRPQRGESRLARRAAAVGGPAGGLGSDVRASGETVVRPPEHAAGPGVRYGGVQRVGGGHSDCRRCSEVAGQEHRELLRIEGRARVSNRPSDGRRSSDVVQPLRSAGGHGRRARRLSKSPAVPRRQTTGRATQFWNLDTGNLGHGFEPRNIDAVDGPAVERAAAGLESRRAAGRVLRWTARAGQAEEEDGKWHGRRRGAVEIGSRGGAG